MADETQFEDTNGMSRAELDELRQVAHEAGRRACKACRKQVIVTWAVMIGVMIGAISVGALMARWLL